MSAKIIIGLGYGDEGKGLATDYFCEPNSIVIRFNGGQQAGHTVIRDGIKHTFSNFGAGSLRGAPTYFSEHCTIYLNSMEIERRVLEEKGAKPVVYAHPLAKLTTPYDLVYGRAREKKLNHGSCGMGVGATMSRHLNTGYKLFAIDLTNIEFLKAKLKNINAYYQTLCEQQEILKEYEEGIAKEEAFFLENVHKNQIRITDYQTLEYYDSLIFEGAQGVLLDEEHGTFPNVTYSRTTSKNAIDICRKIELVPEICYITRSYSTRHGNGFLQTTDTTPVLIKTEEEINKENEWQGKFRVAEISYDALQYAIRCDEIYSSGLSKSIVVTCMDQRPDFIFDFDKLNTTFKSAMMSYGPTANDIRKVELKAKDYVSL